MNVFIALDGSYVCLWSAQIRLLSAIAFDMGLLGAILSDTLQFNWHWTQARELLLLAYWQSRYWMPTWRIYKVYCVAFDA